MIFKVVQLSVTVTSRHLRPAHTRDFEILGLSVVVKATFGIRLFSKNFIPPGLFGP